MHTNNELCKGCCNVGTDRNKWPCVDCCEADRFNEPKPDERSEELLPAVSGCDADSKKYFDFYHIIKSDVFTDGSYCDKDNCGYYIDIRGSKVCRLFGFLDYDKPGAIKTQRSKLCKRYF